MADAHYGAGYSTLVGAPTRVGGNEPHGLDPEVAENAAGPVACGAKVRSQVGPQPEKRKVGSSVLPLTTISG